jgi:hypothetical protein
MLGATAKFGAVLHSLMFKMVNEILCFTNAC